ncbi:MAG: hypothetical protein JSV30_06790 [Candidatus Omnitrophota bacterium]|nr:MAG: hypothetical protein JSV30_06790 [Candidatus Omnitrophota bacterium]
MLVLWLAPEVYDYIYGYFLFRRIGSNLTVNINSDFDKATMVAFWVFENIKQLERYPYLPVIDDNFLNIYKRGFGFCDQGAHVYATMMHWLGFEAKLLMLRKEDGVSPHTVAVVKVKEKYMIVDTTYNFIFAETKDGKKIPIGVDDLGDYPEVFDKYLKVVKDRLAPLGEKAEIKLSWFTNGTYFETFPYCDKKYLFEKIINKIRRRG